MGERIDKYMLEQEMVKTRSQARMLIKQGDVLCNGKAVSKPGQLVSENDQIEIKQRFLYVSRGALKLVKAIEEFSIDFSDKVIADCGASTGGFTQVALIHGAQKVYAIDVGHDQLDKTLLGNSKVINMEGINLKDELILPEKVDFCVADLSFISITKVLHTMKSILKDGGQMMILIKPQFEAGPKRVGKGGIVNPDYHSEILNEVKDFISSTGLIVEKICDSPIEGKAGNKEYLALVKEQIHI